jgi:hypothetical protein
VDILSVVLACVGPLVGVVFGGVLSERAHSRAWRREERSRYRAERRQVYGRYVAAVRAWQSTVLSPDATVRSAGTHRGIAYVDGGPAFDEAIRALAEIRLVASGDEVVDAAVAWERAMREVAMARAASPEQVPEAVLAACRSAGDGFVAAARKDLFAVA